MSCEYKLIDNVVYKRKRFKCVPAYSIIDTAECCICYKRTKVDTDNAKNKYCKELPCGHLFHFSCIDRWLRGNLRCPLCRGSAYEICPGVEYNKSYRMVNVAVGHYNIYKY